MNRAVQSEGTSLIQFCFKHFVNLPASKIQEAVLLISFTQQTEHVFKNLKGDIKNDAKYEKAYDDPQLLQLQGNIKVIHPTEAMLSPESGHNFISVNYLFKTIKKIKLVFVFNQTDTEAKNMKNIKSTFYKLQEIFKKYKGLGDSLGQSSGIIVTFPKNQIEVYYQHFKKILSEPDFMKSRTIQKMLSKIIEKESLIFFKPEKKNKDIFINFVKELKYFDIEDKIDIKKQDSMSKFKIEKNNFISFLTSFWQKKFGDFFSNLINLIQDKPDQRDKQFVSFFAIEQIPRQGDENIRKQKSFPILRVFLNILEILKRIIELGAVTFQDSKDLLLDFLKNLYHSGLINSSAIIYYFEGYFQIYRILEERRYEYPQGDRYEIDLAQIKLQEITESSIFPKVRFTQTTFSKTQEVNSQLRTFLELIVETVEEQINRNDPKYHFKETIKYLQNCLDTVDSILKKLKESHNGGGENRLSFWTVRMEKKIKKFISELKYNNLSTLKKYGMNKNYYRKEWIQFLIYTSNSGLNNYTQIKEGINFLANQLLNEKHYKQAIEVFYLLPEHQVYSQVISIYSVKLKLHPDFLKYTLLDNFQQNLKCLQSYCDFLIKIGFNQKVREICYQGLKFISEKAMQGSSERFKRLLIKARNENAADEYNNYLQKSILKQKEIKISVELMERIRDKMITH